MTAGGGPGSASACIDANVILSILLGEPADQAEAGHDLFERALREGVRLLVFPFTVAEVAMTLDRAYKIARVDVAQELMGFLDHAALQVERGDIVRAAIGIFGTHNVPFGDALLAAEMRAAGCQRVFSWDRHFAAIPGIIRQAPETLSG